MQSERETQNWPLSKQIAADLEDAGLVESGLNGIKAMEVIERRLAAAPQEQAGRFDARVWALSCLDGTLRDQACNDTCSSQLVPGMKCDCWKAKVRNALADDSGIPEGKRYEYLAKSHLDEVQKRAGQVTASAEAGATCFGCEQGWPLREDGVHESKAGNVGQRCKRLGAVGAVSREREISRS